MRLEGTSHVAVPFDQGVLASPAPVTASARPDLAGRSAMGRRAWAARL